MSIFPASRSGRGWGLRWWIAILLCLITTINYLDRQALAIAGPVLIREFELSNTEFGLINSAFLLTYALGHLVVGPLIDRFGTRRAFSWAVLAWSIAGMAHAAGRGFLSFLGLRALLGITEATNFPAAVKAVAEWFPRTERSLAIGIVTVGPGLGAVLAPPLLGGLILLGGWHAAFLVPGAIGLTWLWLWHRYYSLPEVSPHLDEEERQLILGGRESTPAESTATSWRTVFGYLRHREVWGMVLSRFANDGGFYFFIAWLPTYLDQARGFDIVQIAAFVWVPFLAADAGSLAGGWASRQLMMRGWSLDRARKTVIWTGALIVPLTLPAAVVDSAYLALALIGLAMFAIQLKAANLFSLPIDLFPAAQAASIWGLFGAVGAFGGMAFVAAVGWISQHFSYAPVFWAVGITQLLSALFISWLIPRIGQLDTADRAPGSGSIRALD